MTLPIKDKSTGEVYGSLEVGLCHSEQDLEACIGFSFPGGFASYRAQIPLNEIWPMIVVKDISIEEPFQQQGRGTRIIKSLLEDSRSQGIQTAFLRVGWHGENPEAQRDWRIRWYAKLGFKELVNTNPNVLVPFMYCPL